MGNDLIAFILFVIGAIVMVLFLVAIYIITDELGIFLYELTCNGKSIKDTTTQEERDTYRTFFKSLEQQSLCQPKHHT